MRFMVTVKSEHEHFLHIQYDRAVITASLPFRVNVKSEHEQSYDVHTFIDWHDRAVVTASLIYSGKEKYRGDMWNSDLEFAKGLSRKNCPNRFWQILKGCGQNQRAFAGVYVSLQAFFGQMFHFHMLFKHDSFWWELMRPFPPMTYNSNGTKRCFWWVLQAYASQPRACKKYAFLHRCMWIHLLPHICGKHEWHVDIVLQLLVFLCGQRPVIGINNALLELRLLLLIKVSHFFNCMRRLGKTLIIYGFLIHIVLQFLKLQVLHSVERRQRLHIVKETIRFKQLLDQRSHVSGVVKK